MPLGCVSFRTLVMLDSTKKSPYDVVAVTTCLEIEMKAEIYSSKVVYIFWSND